MSFASTHSTAVLPSSLGINILPAKLVALFVGEIVCNDTKKKVRI